MLRSELMLKTELATFKQEAQRENEETTTALEKALRDYMELNIRVEAVERDISQGRRMKARVINL